MNAPAHTNQPLRIFIGFDARESVAYHVLAHSILSRASNPVSITPLYRPLLHRILTRPRGPTESTDFAFSRFLVPYLCDYQGFALFMDADMLLREDIWGLMAYPLAYPGKAVYVCQHDYVPKTTSKFLGQAQTAYPRKNWSSFILFDCAKCTALTPEYVNSATGLDLHRFNWLQEDEVGALPLAYNWLVGEYEPNAEAKNLHFTLGTPCFADYADCDHAEEWWDEYRAMTAPGLATYDALKAHVLVP